MTATLVWLHYSPWSEKAAWALDHHRVPHARRDYVPMLEEPLLRLRTRRLRGRVTVPVLLDAGDQWEDSWEIARHAERVGRGAPLFADLQGVAHWNDVSEVFAAAGRARATARAAQSPQALAETLPGVLGKLGPVTQLSGQLGVAFLREKYHLDARTVAEHAEVMRRELERMRAALAPEPGAAADAKRYLLGELSYADLAVAASLQFLRPVSERYISIGRASRAVWTDTLAPDYPDLLAWRDRIYADHR